jgi:hypothetical protein
MIIRIVPLILMALLALSALADAAGNQFYFKFQVDDPKELIELGKQISIDNFDWTTVWAYANTEQWERFQALGYEYELLPDPGSLIEPRMADSPAGIRDWDTYPTYEGYVAMMEDYALNYPDICILDTIGTTVQGRLLLICIISDNVGVEEYEPEVLYTSTMHGDEAVGYVLTLRLINYLLVNYGSDSQVNNLVDNLEIWINPNANPDGTYITGNSSVSGAQRYNANSVDLNRNFPDPEDGQHPDGNAWQPETVAMMDLAEAQNFVLSANFHGGVEVLNYPWDTWSQRHADDTWFIDICRRYADSAQANSPPGYMTFLNNGITNGYDWYTISGGRQDYMTYFMGGRETTIELSDNKLPPGSQLPDFWNYNRAAMLQWLENAYFGIKGIVTDSTTGLPIPGVVTVLNHDIDSARVFTDPVIGDYHRMIEPGTWDLQFKSPGYVTKTITGVSVAHFSTTYLDVELAQSTADPVLSLESNDIGIVDPGDAVGFHLTLVNWGGGNAANVTADVSTSDSYVTVTQPTSTYPVIYADGGTAESDQLYQFTVASDCPLMHQIDFQVDIEVDGAPHSIDSFSIIAGLPVEDFESGDFLSFDWEMSGDANWEITSGGVQFGVYAAGSGDITDYDTSSLSITLDVISASEISFYRKVSSESNYDYLQFHIDGSMQERWSGEQGWSQVSYPVSVGEHTFTWMYRKDGSVTNGDDRGWIDYVQLPAHLPGLTVLTTTLPDWTMGHPYSQQIEAVGGQGNLIFTDLNNDLAGTGLTLSSSGLLSGIPTSPGLISFIVHVEDEGTSFVEQPLSFTVNSHVAIVTDTLPDAEVDSSYNQQLFASGGTAPLAWTDKHDELSAFGLSMSTNGVISGTTTPVGSVSFTAVVADVVGDSAERLFSFEIVENLLCGDVDGDGNVNVSDVVFLISFVFGDGPPPDPLEVGDVDCNGTINVSDVVYLINYVFGDGPEPCAEC